MAEYADALSRIMLVLPRIGGIIAVAPVFSGRYPSIIKGGISIVLALLVAPLVVLPPVIDGPQLIVTIIAEMIIGFTIGFVAAIAFSVVQVAGQIFDMEMGFGIVNVIDPQYGTQVPLMGNYLHILALVVFLMLDGHHLIVAAIVHSYSGIQIGYLVMTPELTGFIVDLVTTMFATAIKIALPVAGAMFCTNAALGLLAKTVPQMNIFVIGLPVKILGGMAIMTLALTLFSDVVSHIITEAGAGMANVIHLLGR